MNIVNHFQFQLREPVHLQKAWMLKLYVTKVFETSFDELCHIQLTL
jgi:hypothetical protein